MSQWRIIDLQRFEGRLAAKQGRLHVGEQSLAMKDIAVILTGPKCTLHASLIDRAAHYEVPILPCDWRSVPITAITGWSNNSRIAARHRAQVDLSEGRRKNAWMQIVKAKINGQSNNLANPSTARSTLRRYAREVRSGDPTNLEAQAARIYWRNVFNDESFRRGREIQDNYNQLLNYGYTVLRGHAVRAVVAAGLWPTLGIWHHNRSNPFALADDIIEPFRPVVDRAVRDLPVGATLSSKDTKSTLVLACSEPVTENGFSVPTEITKLTQGLARYVEGEIKRLDVPHWQGVEEGG